MESLGCYTCQKSKAPLQCGICNNSICKSCAQFVDEEQFSFLPQKPPELSHSVYCAPCFDQKVAPQIELYEQAMEQAKGIRVYEKNQGKETRLMKRVAAPVHVKNCPDRQETLLRLAFLAAQGGYNGIIDVDIKSEKVIVNSYQTTSWSGSGVPIQLKPERPNRS